MENPGHPLSSRFAADLNHFATKAGEPKAYLIQPSPGTDLIRVFAMLWIRILLTLSLLESVFL